MEAERQAQLRLLNERRWDYCVGATVNNSFLVPYRFSHTELLRMARSSLLKQRKRPAQNRVTDFTGWIYDLIYGPQRSPELLTEGKRGEQAVARIKRRLPLRSHSDWEPIYSDPLDGKPEALEISLLTINGSPLYGAPDYVFRNKTTGTIMIVEIKVSDRELWSDGWPNLRAQLWAYGHIDRFLNSTRDIVLVGEIWGRTQISLRQTLRWHLSDAKFCESNEQLFDIYQNWT
ncbi:MAG: hypothetical protein ACREV9_09975 [Burkholderiales bacterium]